MDIKDFERLWRTEDRRGRSPSQARGIWDERAEEFNNLGLSEGMLGALELMKENRMLHSEAAVLDIGCGPGKYALEYARTARRVVGLDISPKMLQYARENAEKAGVTHVDFTPLDWQEADLGTLGWTKGFDLVTAFMSPAISGKEALDKMIEASRGFCFLSTHVERQDSIKDELLRYILPQREQAPEYTETTIYCSYNILWHYKLYPEIRYHDAQWSSRRSLDEAFGYYINRLASRTTLSGEQKDRIRLFLEGKEKDGVVEEIIRTKVAWLYWKNKAH